MSSKYNIIINIPDVSDIHIELDDEYSPNTVKSFLKKIPFTVSLNLWGDEIYTDKSPITQSEENAKALVELNDVAYWPTGQAICLFYGPTPIGKEGEIKPYSPVNIIGKILNPDKKILGDISDGVKATFSLK